MDIKFIHHIKNVLLRNIRKEYGFYKLKLSAKGFGMEEGVQIKNPDRLSLGTNVIIQKNTILHCGGLDWCNNDGGIEIGDNSVVSPNCVFYGCGAKIIIGRNFDCGPGVKIFASRTKYEQYTPWPDINEHVFADVVIEDNVILFANVVISCGVRLGEGSVIGAGSVVLQDIPPHSLAAGTPAKVIKANIR
jgi:acetyltransferase-like isoleucine patch superfamily enzyme